MPRLLLLLCSALASCSARGNPGAENPPRAARVTPIDADRPLLGLALGGGGTRGFVDGGLTSPVPVSAARALGADIVIAIDVSWFAYARQNGAPAAVPRSAHSLLLERDLQSADIVITPRTAQTRMLDFDYKMHNIAAGEVAANAAIARLQELVQSVSRRKSLARARARPASATAE